MISHCNPLLLKEYQDTFLYSLLIAEYLREGNNRLLSSGFISDLASLGARIK